MPVVAFFKEETSIEVQNIWEKRLKIFIPSITLVPLLSNEAKKAEIALLWKAPLKRLNALKNLKGYRPAPLNGFISYITEFISHLPEEKRIEIGEKIANSSKN